jgi:serine/threonine-protein kinase
MKTVQKIGRYRVDGRIGTGAMGEVYQAYDPVIDRPVAIKMVRSELLSGSGAEQWLERFRREARAAGRRFHPNIVAILDVGEEGGAPFLAMEYVDGRGLDAILKASGRLDPARSVAIITQVLSALGFAHENGIVHRDVKPSNVIVLADGAVKVADFGIARIDDSEFTIIGDVLGTPAYMAPEQLAGTQVDRRADLFAAAVILFEMMGGAKPFRGAGLAEIVSNMETRGPEDIRALNPAVPDALKQVLDRALAFDPARRYATATELSRAIAEALPAQSGETPPLPLPEAKAPAAEPTAPTGLTLPPELVREIEQDLATFVGPLASIAVRRAMRVTSDVTGLYDALSRHVDDPRDRAQFLAKGRPRVAAAPTATGLAPATGTGESSGAAAPPPPVVVSAIEASLTRYIGPIAKILVRRELQKFETLEKLRLVLASHIPDERDREQFLSGQGGNGLVRRDGERPR